MRKFTVLLALLVFAGLQVVLAQKTITGTITSSEDGKPIPGATVVVKNTTIGTTTNVDGFYELSVPDDATTLVFSYVGMISRDLPIGDATVINTVLELDVMDLEGVVVTALGITREKKSLGYAVSELDGEAVNEVRETNFVNSLSGKVSGVQVRQSVTMGGSANVLIRGTTSLTQNNQALFVV
ncbi:MAG: carboxypeptidase-like regulatory domain-containing protein, partial [Bacteroidales bacterium]|nr:carboxypeptidase-like regulatory domain-containing protein [Bacteroidales bacterium]